MLLKVLTTVFAVFLIQVSAESVKYKQCTSPTGSGEVLDVKVDPCPPYGDGGCILKRGHTVTIGIDFKPSENSDVLTHQVHGILFGAAIPYMGIGPPNACVKIDPKPEPCQIDAGQTYKYNSTMDVLASYPAISVDVRWQLIGPGTTVQVCVLIPVKIGD